MEQSEIPDAASSKMHPSSDPVPKLGQCHGDKGQAGRGRSAVREWLWSWRPHTGVPSLLSIDHVGLIPSLQTDSERLRAPQGHPAAGVRPPTPGCAQPPPGCSPAPLPSEDGTALPEVAQALVSSVNQGHSLRLAGWRDATNALPRTSPGESLRLGRPDPPAPRLPEPWALVSVEKPGKRPQSRSINGAPAAYGNLPSQPSGRRPTRRAPGCPAVITCPACPLLWP